MLAQDKSTFTVTARQAVKEFSEKEFLKDVFVSLAKNVSTPPDILDAEFSEVEEGKALLVEVEAVTDIKYSCMVGHDREEEYIDVETRNANTNREEQKIVKKKRTVVDWLPYSGTASSVETVYVRFDSETEDDTDSRILGEVFKNSNIDEAVDGEEYEINSFAMNVAEKIAVKQCYDGVHIGGDHIESESFDGSAQIKRADGLVVPEYYLSYKYKDREYCANAYASGLLKSEVLTPVKSEYVKTTDEVIKKTKLITYFGIAVILAGIILAFCSFFIESLNIGEWYILPIAAGIVIILLNGCVVRQIMRSKILKDKKEKKFEMLQRLILKYDLPPLTQQELKYFNK